MSTLKDPLHLSITGLLKQKLGLGMSVILAIIGQGLIREPQPNPHFQALTAAFERLNQIFHLSLKNPFNIMMGLSLIALAVIIFSQALKSTDKHKNTHQAYVIEPNWANWKKSLPWVIFILAIYAVVMLPLARHQYTAALFWGWLTAILLLTFLFWKIEHKPEASISRLDILWMLFLFAFAISTGSYLLNDLPAGWITDEGPFWSMARDIALDEKKPPFFDTGVFTFPAASSILQGWIMRWAGVTMWGWRFSSILPAAATVIPLYLLASELFDRRVAIATSVIMIVNPYFLSFARLGYNNSQSLFPVTLCIYFLALGIRKNNLFYLWLAGLTAGLGFYTYFAAWLGFVVLVLFVTVHLLLSHEKLRKGLLPLAITMVGALFVLLPRVLYGASGNSEVAMHYKIWETGPINTFYGKLVFGNERIAQTHIFKVDEVEVFYDLPLYGILLVRGIVRSAAVLFDPIGYEDHQVVVGLTGAGSSLFFILGLGVLLANFRNLRFLILSIWFLAGFTFLGVFASIPPRPTHMVAIIPALSLISAIGIVFSLDILANNFENYHRAKSWAIIGVLGIITTLGLFQYFFMSPVFYFPPNHDDYISWLGRQAPAPANMFLVDHTAVARNPMDESSLELTQHKVASLTLADLESDPDQVKTWKNFIAFIGTQNGEEYAEKLAGQIPGARIQTGYAPGQRLRGYVVTDLQINATMDISLSRGIRDLWNSPASGILFLCTVGIIALVVNLWADKIKYRIK